MPLNSLFNHKPRQNTQFCHTIIKCVFIVSIFAFSRAQPIHSLSMGVDWIVYNNTIYCKNLNSANLLRPEELSVIPHEMLPTSVARFVKSFDGKTLYISEEVGNKAFRLRYAESLPSQNGPHWFWHPSIVLKGDYRFLAASKLQTVFYQRNVAGLDGTKELQLLYMDFIKQTPKIILTIEDSNVHIVAIAVDNDFVVFVNNGKIYKLSGTDGTISEIETNFLTKLSSEYINSVTLENGKIIPQPAMFVGEPCFSIEGQILVPIQMRERNTWTRESTQALFSTFPIEKQNQLIEAGKWPLKSDVYHGSDDTFVLMSYDVDLKKVSQVSPKYLTSFVRPNEYTNQIQLLQSKWQPLLELLKNEFVSMESLIQKQKPAKRSDLPLAGGAVPKPN